MKKLIFLTVLLLACISEKMQAQDPAQKVWVGFKGGFNHSNIYDEYADNFHAGPKLGLMGGGFLCIPIGRYIGIQPEFLFAQKGYTANGTVRGNYYAYSHTSTYFEVPLLFAFRPVPVLTLVGGPQFAYLLHTRDTYSSGSATSIEDREYVNDNLRKNTLGAVGGFDINVQHFVFAGRLGWDLQHNNGDGTAYSPRYSNVWLQAAIGFRF